MQDIAILIAGIILGILSGIIPGLHPNTILPLIPISESSGKVAIAMLGAYLCSSLVPSIFFGLPERGNLTAILQSHRFVMEGRGILALRAALLAIIAAGLLSAGLFIASLGA